jgi:hypothetical protein
MEKRKMQRISKNPEQVARFITEDLQRVLAKDIIDFLRASSAAIWDS